MAVRLQGVQCRVAVLDLGHEGAWGDEPGMTATRRLVAIFYADVAGYSRLTGAAMFCSIAELFALGAMGRHDEAQEALARARSFHPDLSIAFVALTLPMSDQAGWKRFSDALRAIGLPEVGKGAG